MIARRCARATAVVGAVLVAAAGLLALPRAEAAPPVVAQAADPQVAAGEQLYLTGCVSCHALGGTGTDQGPTLVGVGAAAADFYLTTGRMPAVDGEGKQSNRKPVAYNPEQIDALVAYVASLGPGPGIPDVQLDDADEAAGGVIYRSNCAACHQSAGSGGALSYGNHAPALDEATATQVVEAMRVGPGQMPVFSETIISDAEADDVAKYVEYLHHPRDPGGLSLGRIGPVAEGFVALLIGLGGLTMFGVWIVGRKRRAAAHG